MSLPSNIIKAMYCDPGIDHYRGNPFIEALPPIMDAKSLKKGLSGVINFNPLDIFMDGNKRAHLIAQLLDTFFQPLARHLQLEEKLSIMIRQGYVGRNIANENLNSHLQNGYERVMSGDLNVFRFDHVKSTAQSLSLIGCSGSGKSSTFNRILATYPQVIYHEKYNFTQITYLKFDCPHDGSLKNLCHHFFRAIDAVLRTDYERKYASKGFGVETLMAQMSQIANIHAIGVLVIDEIQHLSLSKSGGVQKMLNFFVTLVNVIGIPVVMIGTPKARPIFELDLRSARRGAGFGSLLWEPMSAPKPTIDPNSNRRIPTEWIAFTDKLWQYQWLQKRENEISEIVRDLWYELSQGVLDIVVKLFVLAQLRAIASRVERITPELLQKVYDDELRPVHPMLAALRSGNPEQIAKYSDLTIPNLDIRILALRARIDEEQLSSDSEISIYHGNERAIRLHNLLVGMDIPSDRAPMLVERALKNYPESSVQNLIPLILDWHRSTESIPVKQKQSATKISQRDWHTTDTNDLRFIFSQLAKPEEMYSALKGRNLIFDIEGWLKQVG